MIRDYLGDGVYAEEHELGIKLWTMRDIIESHWMVLSTEEFEALLQFAMKIGWLKDGQVLHERR